MIFNRKDCSRADLGPVTYVINSHRTEIRRENIPLHYSSFRWSIIFIFLLSSIFNGRKFLFIGQMADTSIAIESLVKRFGGYTCSKCMNWIDSLIISLEKTLPTTGFGTTTGLFGFNYALTTTTTFDAPQTIICSFDEMEAATPSAELQAYKSYNVTLKIFFFSIDELRISFF